MGEKSRSSQTSVHLLCGLTGLGRVDDRAVGLSVDLSVGGSVVPSAILSNGWSVCRSVIWSVSLSVGRSVGRSEQYHGRGGVLGLKVPTLGAQYINPK